MAGTIFDLPDTYVEPDTNRVKQIGDLWNQTYSDSFAVELPGLVEDLLKTATESEDFNTRIDSLASEIAFDIAAIDSTVNTDSLSQELSNIFWSNAAYPDEDNTIDDDKKKADEFAGVLVGMENARKTLEFEDIDKSVELARIKKHYKLGPNVSADDAYKRLLEDLSADELRKIQKQGTFDKKAFENIDTTKLMPLPLAYKRSSTEDAIQSLLNPLPAGTGGPIGAGSFGPGMWPGAYGGWLLPSEKMTKENFKKYLHKEQYLELEKLNKESGSRRLRLSVEEMDEISTTYANKFADSGYETYQKYQIEVLKDVTSGAITGALDNLEAAADLERRRQGIFTTK